MQRTTKRHATRPHVQCMSIARATAAVQLYQRAAVRAARHTQQTHTTHRHQAAAEQPSDDKLLLLVVVVRVWCDAAAVCERAHHVWTARCVSYMLHAREAPAFHACQVLGSGLVPEQDSAAQAPRQVEHETSTAVRAAHPVLPTGLRVHPNRACVPQCRGNPQTHTTAQRTRTWSVGWLATRHAAPHNSRGQRAAPHTHTTHSTRGAHRR
jgi:hypothetical protein